MINDKEEKQQKSPWEEYIDGSIRLSRVELIALWALTKVSSNENIEKQFQHHYLLYSKVMGLSSRSQRSVFSTVLANNNLYAKLILILKKNQKFSFLPKSEELFGKIACYQEVFSKESSLSSEDKGQIKNVIIRLGMLEEYEDFVILYPLQTDPQDLSITQKGEERIGDVLWSKHEEVYFSILQRMVKTYFETISPGKSTLQLSDLLSLIAFVLPRLIQENDEEQYGKNKDSIASIHTIIIQTLVELEEIVSKSLSGDHINRIKGNIDLVKSNLSDLSRNVENDDRSNARSIRGIQLVLTDSLKIFVNKQSITPPYFPSHKVISKFLEIFTKRIRQELLPEIMPDTHKINKQSLIYAPFTMAYINSGSLSCLVTPEPEQSIFILKFYSTKTGAYRDDTKLTFGVTKTVIPFSETAISANRRSKDSLITRKPEEIMSPFDIRADNKEGVLLLNVSNKGHSPIYVYLFAPGDFLPGEFFDKQTAAALWKQVETDNRSFTPSQETRKRLDELMIHAQEIVQPIVDPVDSTTSSESSFYHPWKRKLDPSVLESHAFKFYGTKETLQINNQKKQEINQESISHVFDAQTDEFFNIILLNEFLRNSVNNDNEYLDVLLKKMNVRKKLEDLYSSLCPKSKIEHLLYNSNEKI